MLDLLALECLEHPDMQLVMLCEETLNLSETVTRVHWVNSAVDWIFFVEDFFVETETVLNYFNFLKKTLLLIPHQSMYDIFSTNCIHC